MWYLIEPIGRALGYLLSQQYQDGRWEDYTLPVGRSDAWITGYVGFALAELSVAEGMQNLSSFAVQAAHTASEWLRTNRRYVAGWGYNGTTGPDADSTAWALRLFKNLGHRIEERDVLFLLSHLRPEGGFATYHGPQNWGVAHPDVTPVVFLSLPARDQRKVKRQVIDYMVATRASDYTWPSYWWRTCHYATFLNMELWHKLRLTNVGNLPVVLDDETHRVYSMFDLACVLGVAAIQTTKDRLIKALIEELLLGQKANGSWPGALNLRVTDPHCKQPWISSYGKLYEDTVALVTTATAIRALLFALKV